MSGKDLMFTVTVLETWRGAGGSWREGLSRRDVTA